MDITLNNPRSGGVSKMLLKKLAELVSKKKLIVSVTFVTASQMKRLNRVYRKKDRPTDVLSFNMDEGKLLGDVIICPQVAKRNAREYGTSYRAEIARLAVHGFLHLLGYDHGKKMFNIQDRVLVRSGVE
jgi:probable rRNA maturation factor